MSIFKDKNTKAVVVQQLCSRGRQFCSRLCHAQIANGRPFYISTEWCGRRGAWLTIRAAEFLYTLCNFWKFVFDNRNTESCSNPAAIQLWHKRCSVRHHEAKSSGAVARTVDENYKPGLSLLLECRASSTSRVWHREPSNGRTCLNSLAQC